MWFSESTAERLALPIIPRPRWEYEDWARIQLPTPENENKHPFCTSLESALIRVVSRNLGGLGGLGQVHTLRYSWKRSELNIKEDPIKSLLYLDHPQGHAFIGSYRHEAYAYTFPCVALTTSRRNQDEYVPVFLRDSDLVEETDYDTSQALFFRNRTLTNLPELVMKSLENRLHPRRSW